MKKIGAFLVAFACISSVTSKELCSDNVIDSDNSIHLIDIVTEHEWENVHKLFFIETSGRDHLLHRQACSVESAIRNSNLPVFVLMNSTHLNPNGNNATRNLLAAYGDKVIFRRVNVKTVIIGTPFEGHLEAIERGIQGSKNMFAHWCDVIRLAVIYKFGGTYSDIDVIFMKSMKPYNNFFSSDQMPIEDQNGIIRYGSVANGLFNIENVKSSFLHDIMNYFLLYFSGHDWSSGGAKPIASVMKELCKVSKSFSVEDFTLDNCNGITQFLDPRLFYPFKWQESTILSEKKTQQFWEDTFKEAVSVDFFESSSGGNSLILKRRYYGSSFPAIVYLGPLHCPISYDSQKRY